MENRMFCYQCQETAGCHAARLPQPNVAKVLAENFGIAGIGTVEDDSKLFFG